MQELLTKNAANIATAQEIYQKVLDDIGACVVARDKEAYVGFVVLPHRLETYERSQMITSQPQLEKYFDALIEHLSDLGVAELTRRCTIAEFVDENTIRGSHETRLINRYVVIVEDYIGLSTLVRVDGVWKVAASQYAEQAPSLPTQVTCKPGTVSQD